MATKPLAHTQLARAVGVEASVVRRAGPLKAAKTSGELDLVSGVLKLITIGKLAALAEISADTLRYYEEERLLSPVGRSAGGYRLYDQDFIRRIRFIKQAQQCGFTLAEIRNLLDLRTRDGAWCEDVRSQVIGKKLQLEHKIKALRSMSKALDRLTADCTHKERPAAECPILAVLEQAGERSAD